MPVLPRFKNLIRNLTRKRERDAELDVEVRAYVDMLAETKMREGMKPEEARRAARIELGGVEQVKERVRDARTGAWLDSLLQDLRYGLRMLRKSPGFTAVAVLTLALGIGANAAIFTLTYAVILKSLPVPNPQQLVRYTFRSGDQDLGLSGPVFDALRKHETVNDDILAWSSDDLPVEENGAVTNVQGALMSGDGFRVLGLRPMLGHTFSDADDVPGGGPNGYQALLGYSYWKQHFGASRDVLGRSLTIHGKPATVIGVLPEGFDGVDAGRDANIVLPLAFEEVLNAPNSMRRHGGSFWLTLIGRLKPGESLRSAVANLQATEAAVRAEADPRHIYLSGFFSRFHMGVESGRGGRSFLRIVYSRPLIALELLVGLLLSLCCANTALLVLARVSSRFREFAVRNALGAPRRRLFRQVLIEVAMLAFFGLAAGLVLGWAAARSLVAMLAALGQPPPLDVTPQFMVIAFTAAISVLSALAAGVWPAVRASRVSPMLGMKQGAASSFSRGLGGWIVPAQVAVSVTLLAAASVLAGSFVRLLSENAGFRPGNAVLADVDLSAIKPSAADSTADAHKIVEATAQVPGVEAAAAMTSPPIHDWFSAGHYFSLGPNGAVHTDMTLWPETVTSDYFAAMGTPILQGRAFSRDDVTGEQVCILSAAAARYFFPNEDAIGRFIYSGGADPAADGKTKVAVDDTFRVIGIAADARFRSLREEAPHMIYHFARKDEISSEFFVIARGPSAGVVAGAIREAARRVVPTAAPPTVFTFDRLVTTHLRRERMLTALSACFAGVALLLTIMGLYGLLARNVVVRTKEIGLRLALGARPRDALRLVLWQGLRLVFVGAIAGLAAAVAVTRLLGSLLFGVSATDPAIFAGVVVALFAVALGASCIPAWRAARIDPMQALRYE
ncbi:MAG TPA: ABC transporter permease [Candidatus Acidoferrum sp.]|nr:ABC transporter permease [Candidatus Acidoferrum sp.]